MVIKPIIPENLSGYSIKIHRYIPLVKRRNYFIIRDKSVGGDAPKEFIKLYEYQEPHNVKKRNWTPYIAKFGHKWYPNESITEHLIVRIGQVLGLKMADSKLVIINKQVRFLSRYFLNSEDEDLVHGYNIYAGYLSDKEIVEEIETRQLARELFTFQFIEKAIHSMFKEESEGILNAFVQMLFFDAIVGNNDRHYYNWAVITHKNAGIKPVFSPIFDTARGLFWNDSDDKIVERTANKAQLAVYINKYIKNSMPKTGFEGVKNPNHLVLVEQLVNYKIDYQSFLSEIINVEKKRRFIQ
jgi:HipA-like C-terminal domain